MGVLGIASLVSPASVSIPCRWRRTTRIRAGTGYGYGGKAAEEVNVMVTGSTGYIGRFVVQELVTRGYNVVAVVRGRSLEEHKKVLFGADLCVADVTNREELERALINKNKKNPQLEQGKGADKIDVVVCCLASRGGGVSDSWKIDYQASRNSLDVGIALGASHFVLLSAICVQKPLLQFQKAKLKLEEEIQNSVGLSSWSIVRPTAFFKSLGGQVESVKSGGPYVMFGDGKLCSCKPISEADLAAFISDCISDTSKHNKVLPIGGPGKALTPLEQGHLLFDIAGKQPKFIAVPIQIMDGAISLLAFLATIFPALEDAAEYARIGRYYASESMLVLDPVTGRYDEDATPSYGTDTLADFFRRVIKEGMAGQELGEQALFSKSK